MKFLLIAIPIFATICWDCSMAQYHFSLDGGEYNFSFNTGDVGDHTREEVRDSLGTVIGKYSYIDPNGNRREMRYRADENGFQPEGYAVHRVPVVETLVQFEVQVPEGLPETVAEEPAREEAIREPIRNDDNLGEVLPEADLVKDQPIFETETTGTTLADTRTETEVATTEVPTTVTEAATASLRNETETEAPTPSSVVVQVFGNSIDAASTGGISTERTKSIGQGPRYPTLLRNPSLLEAPVPLPVAFYHPYRLFNNNVRHIPVLGQAPPGAITFF